MDVPIDQGGVELLGFIQKQLILEYLVLLCEQVAFIDLALLDDGAALPDLTVLPGDLLFCAYPLAEFIIEHAAGGDLDIRLRQQAPFGEDQMDMIVFLCFVVVERRNAFHVISFLELLRELPQHPVGIELRVILRQSNDQFPCLDTFSLSPEAFELLLTLLRQIVPEGHIFPCREGGVQVFLPLWVRNIRYSSLDI